MDIMAISENLGWNSGATPLHIQLFRVGLAALLGGIIGFERETHTRSAGLRTHMLIAMAAAMFTGISFEIFYALKDTTGGMADPLRTVEAVTAGVAFLGAGTIFRMGASVRGLTTGAGMWLAGAVGFACAVGYYVQAVFSTVLALIVLLLLRRFAHQFGPEPDTKAKKKQSA